MASGSLQTIRTHTHQVYDQNAPNSDKDADGDPYDLVTSQTVSAGLGSAVPGTDDVDARTTAYRYSSGSDTTGWTVHSPLQTVNGLGKATTVAFNENAGLHGGEPLVISSSQPSDTAGTGAGTTKVVYYTAGGNSADTDCGNQPAWADLVCKTSPAAQPGTAQLAGLPVTKYTYNTYLEPLAKTETWTAADNSTSTRTTTTTYDSAARTVGRSITTTGTGTGAALPATKTVYDSATGLLTDTDNVDTGGAVTADLNTTYDDFGQIGSYTDATGAVTHYTYDLAGHPTARSDVQGSATLTYNGGTNHTGGMTSETDSLAGTFTETYDPDGDLTTETYPGGTVATYQYDGTGTATDLTYTNPNWATSLSDSIDTNAQGDWVDHNSLNSTRSTPTTPPTA
ncbi:YD repeat-containing protein [Streptomyces sp. yr375]|uniref:RHS repeat domain-containing protein n=1 Tax=Streptomyces sp. yr375 TaxID=1761906 RepID=UPI0008D65B28|nr:RHS repeat domain-containing protein [Streptomyces sp. yr375]SES00686.1 YD repeat-containing protein [Streptomyces sp. yr375]